MVLRKYEQWDKGRGRGEFVMLVDVCFVLFGSLHTLLLQCVSVDYWWRGKGTENGEVVCVHSVLSI